MPPNAVRIDLKSTPRIIRTEDQTARPFILRQFEPQGVKRGPR